jgi:hypothetical protein
MSPKTLLVPELKRVLAPPFAWIDRRFLFDGFLSALSEHENLLYFFLVLASDRDGLSFYSYDKICTLLTLSVDDYVRARDGLIQKKMIAFDGRQFQVLALPKLWPRLKYQRDLRAQSQNNDAQALGKIFAQLTQSSSRQSPSIEKQRSFEHPDKNLSI